MVNGNSETVHEALDKASEQEIFDIYLANLEPLSKTQIREFLSQKINLKKNLQLRKGLNEHYVRQFNLESSEFELMGRRSNDKAVYDIIELSNVILKGEKTLKREMHREKDFKLYAAKLEGRLDDMEIEMFNMRIHHDDDINTLYGVIRKLKEDIEDLFELVEDRDGRKTKTRISNEQNENQNNEKQPEVQIIETITNNIDMTEQETRIEPPNNEQLAATPAVLEQQQQTQVKTSVQPKKIEFAPNNKGPSWATIVGNGQHETLKSAEKVEKACVYIGVKR
jgi:hypothetical protein